MTKEEAKEVFLNRGFVNGLFDGDKWRQSIVVISKWLEQDTVPFDFELYQAGLMDMPKGVIEVLDKIRAEIEFIPTIEWKDDGTTYILASYFKKQVLEIIDKYKAESENRE